MLLLYFGLHNFSNLLLFDHTRLDFVLGEFEGLRKRETQFLLELSKALVLLLHQLLAHLDVLL